MDTYPYWDTSCTQCTVCVIYYRTPSEIKTPTKWRVVPNKACPCPDNAIHVCGCAHVVLTCSVARPSVRRTRPPTVACVKLRMRCVWYVLMCLIVVIGSLSICRSSWQSSHSRCCFRGLPQHGTFVACSR